MNPFLHLLTYVSVCLLSCDASVNTQLETKDEPLSDTVTVTESSSFQSSELKVCSFNIKFVGLYKKKDHSALADLLKDYDLVVIQELVSPPADGVFPDGSSYAMDEEARLFAEAMVAHGFAYTLSSEDTGTNDEIHKNSSATEWFIAFFKEDLVRPAMDLPNGFLADDRSNHPNYERVPFAFPFITADGLLDFVLISVHLQPGSSSANKTRRLEELTTIAQWIDQRDSVEKDFIVLGDMNIYSREELNAVTPTGYQSLNEACLPTNIASVGRPYDHVMYSLEHTADDLLGDFEVLDLVEEMRGYWDSSDPYPENDRNLFYQYYSDHRPIVFTMITGNDHD